MTEVSLFFIIFFGVAGIAAWLGDWSGWVVLGLFALMFLSAWLLNTRIFKAKTLHNDHEKENEAEAELHGLSYERRPHDPHH